MRTNAVLKYESGSDRAARLPRRIWHAVRWHRNLTWEAIGPLADRPNNRKVRASDVARHWRPALAGVLACVLMGLLFVPPWLAARSFRAVAVADLRAAAAAGPNWIYGEPGSASMGFSWRNDDGSSVAVRYATGGERRGEASWCKAVALDSAGNWYESERDYGPDLRADTDLPDARQSLRQSQELLLRMGFRPTAP